MDSDSDDEQDGDGDNDPGRVEGNAENLSSPGEVNHLLNPDPLESLPTSSQMANSVDDEVHQSDSAADCDWEKKEQHHGNEGSMSKLALSETQSEQTVDPSQLQPKTLNQEEQSPESHPGDIISIATSVPQPQTYTDNVESRGDIERDESNRLEDDGCGLRSKRRRMLLDLESSDEEP